MLLFAMLNSRLEGRLGRLLCFTFIFVYFPFFGLAAKMECR